MCIYDNAGDDDDDDDHNDDDGGTLEMTKSRYKLIPRFFFPFFGLIAKSFVWFSLLFAGWTWSYHSFKRKWHFSHQREMRRIYFPLAWWSLLLPGRTITRRGINPSPKNWRDHLKKSRSRNGSQKISERATQKQKPRDTQIGERQPANGCQYIYLLIVPDVDHFAEMG